MQLLRLAVIAAVVAGCSATTYRIDGVTYSNIDEALAASQARNERVLDGITPRTPVAGQLLVMVPSAEHLARTDFKGVPPALIDYNSRNSQADYTMVGRAFVKSKAFSTTEIKVVEDPTSAASNAARDHDAVLYPKRIEKRIVWTMVRSGREPRVITVDDKEVGAARVNALIEATALTYSNAH
jgi:hypothetical protein